MQLFRRGEQQAERHRRRELFTNLKTNIMTQKEALKQLQAYCTANGFTLSPSSLPKQTYAIILADGDAGEITTRYPNDKISGYYTAKELLIWIDGYHKGLQSK